MRDGVGMEGRRQGKGCDGEAKKREGGQTYQDRRGGRDKRMDTAEMKRMEGHDNEIGWRRRKRG